MTHWLLERQPCDLDIEACVAEYKSGVAELQHKMSKLLVGDELRRFQETRELYANIGVPDTLSERVASLQPIIPDLDIVEVEIVRSEGVDPAEVDEADELDIVEGLDVVDDELEVAQDHARAGEAVLVIGPHRADTAERKLFLHGHKVAGGHAAAQAQAQAAVAPTPSRRRDSLALVKVHRALRRTAGHHSGCAMS